MLDIKYIHEHLEEVKRGVAAKNFKIDFDALLALDSERRTLQKKVDEMRSEKNKASGLIPKASKEEKEKIIARMKEIDQLGGDEEKRLAVVSAELSGLLETLPNLALPDVKVGLDERENEILREVGRKPNLSEPIKDYLELSKKSEIIDIERA